ncbi:hypothetical protein [Streptomyces sp. NPDC001927]
MAETTSFPSDLLTAQRDLHEAKAKYAALCRTLPWSVEPMPGWPGQVHPHTGEVTGSREDSPGYTEEEKAECVRLLGLIRELSIQVSTHSCWRHWEGEDVVKARMEVKNHSDVLPAVVEAA